MKHFFLSLLLAPCMLLCSCQTTSQQPAVNPPISVAKSDVMDKIKDTISSIDSSANSFLQNPLVQIGAAPAGQLLTVTGLLSFQLSGGDPAPFADQICYWESLLYTAVGDGPVTPAQVDAVGLTFNSNLNASDKKFAIAFGPVQNYFKKMVGTPGVSRQTVMAFLDGIGKGAAPFTTPKAQ